MALPDTPQELTKFTRIPGIAEGKSESVSKSTTATNRRGQLTLGQKLRIAYRGEMIGEIPGNPLCEMALLGFDHGHRGPTVSKMIAVSEVQLLVVVEQKGYRGRILDKVYRLSKEGEGSWLVTELGIGVINEANQE